MPCSKVEAISGLKVQEMVIHRIDSLYRQRDPCYLLHFVGVIDVTT